MVVFVEAFKKTPIIILFVFMHCWLLSLFKTVFSWYPRGALESFQSEAGYLSNGQVS